MFRAAWWGSNLLFAVSLLGVIYSGVREYSVRRYLDGFSDAIVPSVLPAEPKVQGILNWMRVEPSRAIAANPDTLAARDPYITLNYKQLLEMCGTATNAFLNLAREDDLQVRRLLLLSPDGKAKHVVAEVLIEGRWIVVDPTYRLIMRDANGRMLTRTDLQRPELLAQATSGVPTYPPMYTYEKVAHVRIARLPMHGLGLGRFLDAAYPGWDESVDWSLLLERESFFYLALSVSAAIFFLIVRTALAWYADTRLKIPRFRFREKMIRASAEFLTTPEIKQ